MKMWEKNKATATKILFERKKREVGVR